MDIFETEPADEVDAAIDPQIVFESIVSELEYLIAESHVGERAGLLELHAALLVYNLGGQASLLPTPTFGMSTRRVRERRVLRIARRIEEHAGGDSAVAIEFAATLIERNLDLIDPDLRALAA